MTAVASLALIAKADGDLVYSSDRVARLVFHAEKRIRDAFMLSIGLIRNTETLTEIARLLEAGQIDEALRFAQQAGARVASQVGIEYVNAGRDAAEFLTRAPGLAVVIDFDQSHERAVRRLSESRFRMIREFTEDSRGAVRAALTDAAERGLNPIDSARRFRGAIGLTERQMRAVNNYRSLLESGSNEALTRSLRDRRFDSTVRTAARGGKPLTTAQVNRMVQRYRERYLRYRSEVISRTESLREVHAGTSELFQQATESGQLDPQQLVKEWHTAGDAKVRDPAHTYMNGQRRMEGEFFQSGAGNLLEYPGDYRAPASETAQCRCGMSRRITSVKRGENE